MSGRETTPLEVSLCGERFRLRAEESVHERLHQMAALVERRVKDLMKGGAASTLQRAALMTAFHIANEAEEVKNRAGLSDEARRTIEQRIERMILQVDEQLRSGNSKT